VKLLIDANLSPRVADALRSIEHEAVHVGDIGLLTASDKAILDWADEHDHAVITADSDFAMMLAVGGASGPSVVQLRGVADQPPSIHEALLIENLPAFSDALAAGAIVSLGVSSFRIRDLPIE
jgi:predicted nuclease of predicted toxin-antitoxin system